jgi:predicted enzyme related to lactoylglutathione lyase
MAGLFCSKAWHAVMDTSNTPSPSAFCWLDLAAADADRAKAFYARLFGWTFHDQHANGGTFTCLRSGSQNLGSLYALSPRQLAHGVPSHWTPYVRVVDLDAAAARAVDLGGRLVIAPFEVAHTAHIALIEDAVGALVGLWQSMP